MAKYNLQTKIKGALRQVARYAPQVKECMELSIHKTIRGPRGGKMYRCNECGKAFKANEIQVDHIEPVIPLNKSTEDLDWNTIIKRMFCGVKNLQVLCKNCHAIKSKEERASRKKYRDDNK